MGAYDMGGDVSQWDDTVVDSGLSRGSEALHITTAGQICLRTRVMVPPIRPTRARKIGFRVASIPEPSAGMVGDHRLWIARVVAKAILATKIGLRVALALLAQPSRQRALTPAFASVRRGRSQKLATTNGEGGHAAARFCCSLRPSRLRGWQ